MNRFVTGIIRQVLLVFLGVGILLVSSSWAAVITTPINVGHPIKQTLQIDIAGEITAGSFPTQTFLSGSGIFEILGEVKSTIDEFYLLITVPTLTGFTDFTLTPMSDGTGGPPITVMSGSFDPVLPGAGSRPGDTGDLDEVNAQYYAWVDLGLGPATHSGRGPQSYSPMIQVGFSGVPGLPTTFFAYGAVGSDLKYTSANSESLTIVPEPGTLGLLGLGLVGIAVGARRRKKN